jgi:hypothetical protein
MDNEKISELEERLQKTVYSNTIMLKYLGFTLGKINLDKEEIQEVMDFLIKKEEYKLCDKLQKMKQKSDTS